MKIKIELEAHEAEWIFKALSKADSFDIFTKQLRMKIAQAAQQAAEPGEGKKE